MNLLRDLVWLRPTWLWALLALPLLPLALHRLSAGGNVWTRAVDAHLLPHLLDAGMARGSRWPALLLVAGAALAIVAMAGPSLRQQQSPLWQVRSPLVVAVDMSSSMRATDLKPSRAAQARYELATLLRERRGGQVGLLAYADDAYSVAPLTRDARTVAALVDQLDPEIMPGDGQRADRAIRRAQSLLANAGFTTGDILLLTDRADDAARAAAQDARAAGFHVHALGIGTLAGAPLAGPQGFLTDANGQVQFARLDSASLSALTAAGGGRYAAITPDDADLRALGVLDPQAQAQQSTGDELATLRSDDGYWLLLALLPLALLGFRRNWLALLPLALAAALLQAPAPARAAGEPPVPASPVAAPESWWDALWQRSDQRAHEALVAGDAARARRLAKDDATRGAADFRAGDYTKAARDWAGTDGPDAHYNRGNALAQSGRYEDALAAYDSALAQAPGMGDAVENRRIVEEQLKKQQQQKQQDEQQQQQQDQQQQDQQQQQGKQDSQQQDSQQQDSQQQDSQQQDSEQQDGRQQDAKPQDQKQAGRQQDSQQPDAAQQGTETQDAEQQQRAAEAQKEAMEQALAGEQQEPKPGEEQHQARVLTPAEREEAEREQAVEQGLRRVPDDPGGLLRRKFALEQQRRRAEGEGE